MLNYLDIDPNIDPQCVILAVEDVALATCTQIVYRVHIFKV